MNYKAIGLTLLTICFLSVGNAQDLEAIEDSRGAFIGAINGVLDDNVGSIQYIPNYGYHIQARDYLGIENELEEFLTSLVTVFKGLGQTVEGLQDDDWLSLAYKNDDYQIIIRAKSNNFDDIEIWVDNEKRE